MPHLTATDATEASDGLITGRPEKPATLVLVDVKWVRWLVHRRTDPDECPSAHFADLLSELLRDEQPGPARDGADAWLLCDPGATSVLDVAARLPPATHDSARVLIRAVGEELDAALALARQAPKTAPGPTKNGAPWVTGSTALELVERIEAGLSRCEEIAHRLLLDDDEIVRDLLNLFACRVSLRSDQLDRLFPDRRSPAGLDAVACIDFRFAHHLNNPWLYAYLSLWSTDPASRAHSPTPAGSLSAESRSGRIDVVDHEALRAMWLETSTAFSTKLSSFFPIVSVAESEGAHWPPRFWVATGDDTLVSDVSTPNLQQSAVGAVVRNLLGAPPASTSVAAAVVDGRAGRALILRRFLARENAASYLVLPDPARGPYQREEIARELIYGLTRIETVAAASLFDVSSDLDMNENLCAIYDAVELRASVLWDEAARWLPDAKGGTNLRAVHRQVQLIHLVLLHGVADIGWVSTAGATAVERVEHQAARIATAFVAEGFAETPVEGQESLLRDMQTGGYVDGTARAAAAGLAAIERVRDSYQLLISSISHTFDSQRFRYTDRLTELGILIAGVLATVGLITESFAVLLGWIDLKAWSILLLVALVSVLATVVWTTWRRSFQNLGEILSPEFAPAYAGLRRYLSASRTDRLERIREADLKRLRLALTDLGVTVHDTWQGSFDEWRELDRTLSTDLAALVDTFDHTALDQMAAAAVLDDRERLTRGIERWVTMGLIASERPRDFYGYPLPRLALIYRTFPIVRSELVAWDKPKSLLAEVDLALTLRMACGAARAEVDELCTWIGAQLDARWTPGAPPRAADLLVRLDALGLEAGMSRRSWLELLGKIRVTGLTQGAN